MFEVGSTSGSRLPYTEGRDIAERFVRSLRVGRGIVLVFPGEPALFFLKTVIFLRISQIFSNILRNSYNISENLKIFQNFSEFLRIAKNEIFRLRRERD